MSPMAPQEPGTLALLPDAWHIWENFTPRFEHASVHHHNGYEFFLHVRGGGLYRLDQQVFTLQPYQLLIIRPQQIHGPLSRQPLVNFERLLIQVSENVLSQLHFHGTSLRNIVEQHCSREQEQILLTPQDYLQLKSLMELVPPAREIASVAARSEALGYLTVLLSRFCRSMDAARQHDEPAGSDGLMAQVRDHILAHFMEDCSLESLSARFSISKYHLSRRFSETYGIGLHQYVLQCRMAYARKLIRQGDPMMLISYQCGYNDYSSFVRAFTRFYGANPRAWRKQQLLQRQREGKGKGA